MEVTTTDIDSTSAATLASLAAPSALDLHQRMRGLLLGGAYGDALGAPVEFMKRKEILARFGPQGIATFAPAYGRLGAITDDTQMTLFTLEGLMRACTRYSEKGICHPPSVVDHAYRRWFATQGDAPPDLRRWEGWLIKQEGLWERRAPGLTCLSALDGKGGFGELAQNDSKDAGGIMRVGPAGLVNFDAFELARDIAALTHGHVTGSVAAGWFGAWIQNIDRGWNLRTAAWTAWSDCKGQAPELDAAILQALQLAGEGGSDCVPPELGEGWIAEEAAAITLWCVLTATDPVQAVRLAVNIDGDSDTTGSLVGQVMGTAFGPGWIPPDMLAQLELVEVMEQMAKDAAFIFSPQYKLSPQLWEMYPGC